MADSKIKRASFLTLQLCINASDDAVDPGVVDMLSSQGRMKYLRPLYRSADTMLVQVGSLSLLCLQKMLDRLCRICIVRVFEPITIIISSRSSPFCV